MIYCDEITRNLLKSEEGILSGAVNSVISPVELVLQQKEQNTNKEEELIRLKELIGDILEIVESPI